MSFEFYEGAKTDGATKAQVTVRKGGQLVLTQAAVAMLGEGATHVQVGYDPDSRAIGIRAADEATQGRYRLRAQGTSGRRLVDGKRLFALHGIEMDRAQTFDAEDFGDGIVGVTLPDGEANAEKAPKSKRTKTRAAA